MEKDVMGFLNRIMKAKLERDPKTYFYSLGDPYLDKIFTFPNEKPVYTPNSEDVESLANVAYILALMGCKPTNFTSVPAGFMMTVENEQGEHKTFFINKTMEKWNRELLKEIAKEIVVKNGSEFHREIGKALAKGADFRDICISCGAYKTSPLLTEEQKARIEESILEFNSDKDHPNSLNNQNCNNNHKILDRVCRHSLGVDMGKTSVEQEEMVKEIYDLTLFHWILPGYKAFRGVTADGEATEKYGKILNNRALEVIERFPDYHDACAVMNMCSTDYTADVAYAIMTVYEKGLDKAKADSEIEAINPQTPNNKQEKAEIRRLVAEVSPNGKGK